MDTERTSLSDDEILGSSVEDELGLGDADGDDTDGDTTDGTDGDGDSGGDADTDDA
jgi:hypothetical protein